MSYNTNYISTGKLQATNVNIYPDLSGNYAASLEAVQITAGSITATQVNADNFQYTNLDLSGDLTVGGDLLVEGAVVLTDINASTLNVGGTTIDSSGNVVIVGDSATFKGSRIATISDLSNVQFNIPSSLVLQSLDVSGQIVTKSLNIVGTNATLAGVKIATVNDISGAIAVLTNGADSALDTLLEIDNYIKDTSNNLGQVLTTLSYKAPLANPNFTGLVDVSGNLNVRRNIHSNTLDVSGQVLAGSVLVPGRVVTQLLDVSGDLVTSTLNTKVISTPSGFSVDSIGGLTVPSNANILGEASFSNNVTIDKNLSIVKNQYIGGQLYSNKGIVVGDTLNGLGVQLDSSGGVLVLSQKDISGNVTPATLNVSGALKVASSSGTLAGVQIATLNDLSSNLVPKAPLVNPNFIGMVDISGNLNVRKNIHSETLDVSGQLLTGSLVSNSLVSNSLVSNSLVSNSLVSNSLVSSNVNINNNLSVAGDTSLNNVVINGNATLDNLGVLTDVSVEGNVNITESNSVSGGLYVEGNVYSNNGFVVGDTDYGDGVTLISGLGSNILNVVGVTQDLSQNVFSIGMNVGGYLSLQTDSSSSSFSTVTDGSGEYVLGITTPNVVESGSSIPTEKIKIKINNTYYYLNVTPA